MSIGEYGCYLTSQLLQTILCAFFTTSNETKTVMAWYRKLKVYSRAVGGFFPIRWALFIAWKASECLSVDNVIISSSLGPYEPV